LTKSQIKTALFTMNGIEEVKIWAFICQYDTGEIRVSLRSREYDINQVAKNYEGGGHRLASGAKLKKMSEVNKLIKDLEKIMDGERE
jgi:phosphoesterase RecJ-like protein